MKPQPWHIVVLVIALVVLFGWKHLPNMARSLGQSMRIFKSEVDQMREPSAASQDTVKGERAEGAGLRDRAADLGERARDTAEGVRDRARDTAEGVRETGASVADEFRDGLRGGQDTTDEARRDEPRA